MGDPLPAVDNVERINCYYSYVYQDEAQVSFRGSMGLYQAKTLPLGPQCLTPNSRPSAHYNGVPNLSALIFN